MKIRSTGSIFATAAVTVGAILAATPFAAACIHAPRDYEGSLEETSQQALVFWADGREELVLNIAYEVVKGDAPTSLAWVVPVPNVPDHYAVSEPGVFKELFDLTEVKRPGRGERARGTFGDDEAEKENGIELLDPVTVGDYAIQPIKGRGADAGPALNAWLTENGFGEVPEANMAYYLERDWTFLAIRMGPKKGQTRIEGHGDFRPLRISFAADRIYYPLKFSSHQGTFDVTLYVVTEKGLPTDERGLPTDEITSRLKQFGFHHANMSVPVKLSNGELQRHAKELVGLWREIVSEKRIGLRKGILTKLVARDVNDPKRNPVSAWEEDFSIEP